MASIEQAVFGSAAFPIKDTFLMQRSLAIHLAFLSAAVVTSASANDLMPPHIMQQLGLTQAWARPVPVPAGAQSIADQQLFVHQENPRELVEIVMVPKADASAAATESASEGAGSAGNGSAGNGSAGNGSAGKVLARIPTDQIQANGKPIGRKEAERLATNEIRRLKRRGIEAKINVRTVPRVNLYTLGSDGTLESRDAETGEPNWLVGIGNPRLPYMAIGVSEHFLTVINGANLIQVEAATGDVVVEVPMPGTPGYGATNAGDFAMIPLVGGGIQGYPLSDPTIDPFLEQVAGAALALPMKSPDSSRTAWSTDRGFIYVIEMEGAPSLLFRLKTDGIVSGRLTPASGNRFYFGSEAGLVYGLRATRSGQVMWVAPVGEPFYNEATVFHDQVLLRSTYGNLFSLHVDDGHMTWERPISSIGNLLGALDGRLYATTLSGVLTVIDLETGKRIASFPEMLPGKFLVNTVTDRLYLVSDSGDVQCLRLEDADLPTFNTQPDGNPVIEEEEDGKPVKEKTPPPFGAGGTDPFGAGGADPFGAGGADPFGAGGADPFGAGGDAPMDDPFGGGGAAEDPFGANPFGGN